MKKLIILSVTALCFSTLSHAKVWRVNNNVGVDADFTQVSTAVADGNVVNGDTIYIEPSASNYNGFTLTKQLVFIGNGYFLDTSGTNNGNPGLQENVNHSYVGSVTLQAGSEGSVFKGLVLYYLSFSTIASQVDITMENCFYSYQSIGFNSNSARSGITIRKCFFDGYFIINEPSIVFSNVTIENNIIENYARFNCDVTSTNVIFRNNTVENYLNMNNVYVANNLILGTSNSTLTSCVVKNNLFVRNQAGVTTGALSTNGNNLVAQSRASLILDAGSVDGKYMLAAASPAIGGGVDIGGVKPDCGAFGGNDPYVLSGIPNIPTIYSLSFPNGNSVPSGAATIEEDFSTRNNK